MKTKNKTPMSCLKWVGMGFLALLFIVVSVPSRAQQKTLDGTQVYGDYSALRTNTWSVYLQGGTSWARGVWYQNESARWSYGVSPAVGAGFDYNFFPWVRLGVEYLYSGYRREQRLSELNINADPVFAYGNYTVRYHNIKMVAGFNLMEVFPERRTTWLNLYAGTGAGYMLANGNEYGIYFSTTQTQNGVTTPVSGNIQVDNESPLVITSNVTTRNLASAFNRVYVPVSLHLEADINPRLTIGLKGESNWVLNRREIAPKGLFFALATLRYNFVPGKAQMMKKRCIEKEMEMNNRLQLALAEAEAKRIIAEKAVAEQKRLNQENETLKKDLEECQKSHVVVEIADEREKQSHYVQFDHNSSYFNAEEAEKLKAFASQIVGKKLSLVAEASTPGEEQYNQILSEQRLQRVLDALVKMGIPRQDLQPAIAIGEARGIPTAEGRRVTIKEQ